MISTGSVSCSASLFHILFGDHVKVNPFFFFFKEKVIDFMVFPIFAVELHFCMCAKHGEFSYNCQFCLGYLLATVRE